MLSSFYCYQKMQLEPIDTIKQSFPENHMNANKHDWKFYFIYWHEEQQKEKVDTSL